MDNMNQFGEYLKAARQRKGLSLRAVEDAIAISNAYLSQLEQGKIKQPSPVVLNKLSQLYDLSYAEMMRLVGYPVPGDDDTEEEEGLGLAARLGPVTDEEEEELLDYLEFLRSRRNKGK
jgi:transcriptional regulator with XRE-family HTH domain